MAYIYSQEGRWEKAIAEYKKLIKLDPEDFNAQNMMGDVYVKKGEAQPAFESYWIASEAYSRLGQLEKAGVVYRKIAKLDTKQLNPESQKKQAVFQKLAEGDTALEAGEFDKAIDAYQAVLQLDPERFDIFQKLGDLHLRKGELDKAVRQYKEIADIYFKNKLHKKAAPIYKKVIELDPSDVDSHAAMGEIHAKAGNESDAKKEYLLIAEAMLNKGDLDTAMNFAKKAVALKSIEAYFYLGQVLFKQSKFEEAKGEFEKLLRVKSNHAGALVSMGQILLRGGNGDEALKNFEKALKVDKNNIEAYELAAAQLAIKGQNPQAAAYLAEASSLASLSNQAERSAELAKKARGLDPAVKMPDGQATGGAAHVEGSGMAAAPVTPPAPATLAPTQSAAEAEPVAEPLHEELPSAAPALPPLPIIQEAPRPMPTPAAPAPPPQPEAQAPADPQEERATLLTMAQNFVAEGSLDEALSVYQRILTDFPDDAEAKAGQRRVFSLLAQDAMGGAAPAVAHSAQEDEARRKAEADAAKQRAEEDARLKAEAAEAAARLEQLRQQAEDEQRKLVEMRRAQEEARKKQEADEAARREAEEARRKAEDEAAQKKQEEENKRLSEDELRKQVEAQIRKQLEEEYRRKAEDEARKRADEEVERKVEEARKKAEEEARKKIEEETRRKFEEERKKLESEKEETRKKLEAEMRLAIEAQEKAKFDQESLTKVDAERKKAELEAKQKIQQEVLARVQSQQKEKQAVYQKTIEEIRKKVEEAKQAPGEAAKPAAASASSAVDEMDDFMTAAVADIYTKQGLVKEAVKIYEKILAREPGNADIRKKLDALTGKGPAPEAAKPDDKGDEGAKKKSKVSYL